MAVSWKSCHLKPKPFPCTMIHIYQKMKSFPEIELKKMLEKYGEMKLKSNKEKYTEVHEFDERW